MTFLTIKTKKMKRFYFLLFLLLIICCSKDIKAQDDYQSLVVENKMWSCGWEIIDYYTSYWIKFSGDTIINDNNYKRIWMSSYSNTPDNWELHEGYVREDTIGKKVYFMNNDLEEGLIYDFDVNIGDTINIHNRNEDWWDNECPFYDELQLIVDTIYYMEILESTRKAVVVREINDTIKETWIEGIGSNAGVLKSGSFLFPELSCSGDISYMFLANYLMCYYENEEVVYKNPDNLYFPSCNYSTNNIFDDFNKREQLFNVFPNPVTGKSFTIDFNACFIGHIYIYDVYGRMVYQKHINKPASQIKIVLHNIPEGFYLINALHESGRTDSNKIIIKN